MLHLGGNPKLEHVLDPPNTLASARRPSELRHRRLIRAVTAQDPGLLTPGAPGVGWGRSQREAGLVGISHFGPCEALHSPGHPPRTFCPQLEVSS